MQLFMCYTVLQLYIAIRIATLEKLGGSKCEFILFFEKETPRSQYYFFEALKLTKYVTVIYGYKFSEADKTPKKHAKEFLKKLHHRKFENVYIASTDRIDACYFLSKISFKNIITHDDGSGNINSHSLFYYNDEPSKLKRIRRRILKGQKYFPIDLKRRSFVHYSIFEASASRNVKSKIIYLDIFNYNKMRKIDTRSLSIDIFLGTFYRDMILPDTMNSVIKKLEIFMDKQKIDMYIPHPRDEVDYFNGKFNYIIPEKIAEEIVVDYLDKNYQVNVYGIASTTLINLSQINNVNVYTITSNLFTASVNEFHLLSNIKVINIDD